MDGHRGRGRRHAPPGLRSAAHAGTMTGAGGRRSTRRAWNTRRQARRAPRGSGRRGLEHESVRQTQEIRAVIALEIALNGKRLCVTGIPVGTVTAIVGTKRRHRGGPHPGRTRPRMMESALLTVSGYTETPTAHEFPWWVSRNSPPHLRVEDTVAVRVVDIPRPNKHRSRDRWSKRALDYSEHREYLRLKRKYGVRATGTAWEPTSWRAVQRAALEALRKAEVTQ